MLSASNHRRTSSCKGSPSYLGSAPAECIDIELADPKKVEDVHRPVLVVSTHKLRYFAICSFTTVAVLIVMILGTLCQFFSQQEGYYPQWLAMRQHLSDVSDPAVVHIRSELYFYDLNMDYVVSFRGLFFVLGWNLWRRYCFGPLCPNAELFKSTETNHALSMWYFQPYVRGDPKFRNPTKWDFAHLKSSPFPKKMVQKSVDLLKSHAADVRTEYVNNVVGNLIVHPDQRTEVNGGHWDWNFLYGTTGKNQEVCDRVPLTTAVVNKLPTTYNYGFAFFSRLKPGTHIKAHTGSTNLRIRLHLGLVIPDEPDYQATIRVGTEHQAWAQDDVLVFDDAFEHEVIYEGKTERAVFIVDIWHPDLSDREKELLSWGGFGPFGTVGRSQRKLD